ncbi:Putative conjugative transfer protein TraD [Rickettsia canadensis str. McKiel]|uniref:Putative conjugative transfer protein TraD n=1 Tax=Rickettsia canadensis (strain McKiel) TaxID=293613 RepID=A8EYP4_RICCK|nr:TraD N-terminal domain-containing protein [Rickettsia canadensis]ABV73477.1 Putative conjugative transfer protein TraD [Rickettsia canadensis str. McKiel]
MIGVVSVLAWLMLRTFQKLSLLSLYYFIIERYVQLKLAIGQYFYPLEQIGIKFYYIEQKAWGYRNAKEFIHKFWHVTLHSHNINEFEQFLLHPALQEAVVAFTIGIFTVIIFFIYRVK